MKKDYYDEQWIVSPPELDIYVAAEVPYSEVEVWTLVLRQLCYFVKTSCVETVSDLFAYSSYDSLSFVTFSS